MTSRDEQIQEDHERYLEEVTQSGMPLWIAEMYGNAQPQPKQEPKRSTEEGHKDDNTSNH